MVLEFINIISQMPSHPNVNLFGVTRTKIPQRLADMHPSKQMIAKETRTDQSCLHFVGTANTKIGGSLMISSAGVLSTE
jgi:hypothetical protein